MRALGVGLAVVLLVGGSGVAEAFQVELEVEDLLREPDRWSSVEVQVVGELVGDYGRRGAYVWTQLNGDSYATAPLRRGGPLAGANVGIAVRIPAALLGEVGGPGRYDRRGPVVSVVGEWRWHDAGRSGETYLDVHDLDVVLPAEPLTEDVSPVVLVSAVVLWSAVAAMWWWLRRGRRPSLPFWRR